jgi:hypothetical protein
MSHRDAFNALIDTMKIAVAALRDADVPFVLGGSVAAWARGGPEPDNDLDLMVAPAHADAALDYSKLLRAAACEWSAPATRSEAPSRPRYRAHATG